MSTPSTDTPGPFERYGHWAIRHSVRHQALTAGVPVAAAAGVSLAMGVPPLFVALGAVGLALFTTVIAVVVHRMVLPAATHPIRHLDLPDHVLVRRAMNTVTLRRRTVTLPPRLRDLALDEARRMAELPPRWAMGLLLGMAAFQLILGVVQVAMGDVTRSLLSFATFLLMAGLYGLNRVMRSRLRAADSLILAAPDGAPTSPR